MMIRVEIVRLAGRSSLRVSSNIGPLFEDLRPVASDKVVKKIFRIAGTVVESFEHQTMTSLRLLLALATVAIAVPLPAAAELVTPVPLRTKEPASPAPLPAPTAAAPVATPSGAVPSGVPATGTPGQGTSPASAAPALPLATADPMAAARIGPNWAAFVGLVNAEVDETEMIVTHEVRGNLVSDDTYKITARRPMSTRCEALAGPNKGGVVVWIGGEKVKAHPGGVLSHVVVIANRHDRRATDLVGYGCGETTLTNIVAYWTAHGTIVESPGTPVDGVATAMIAWTPQADFPLGLTREELYLSTVTHLPVMTKGYIGTMLVENSKFTSIALNANVPDSAFDVRSR